MIRQRIIEFLKTYDLQNKTIIVGFSGGYDSMCLLDVLTKIRDEEFYNMRIVAAHFNHNWRGTESLQEQEVCRLFAKAKGCDFFTRTAPTSLKKTENDARIARYEFFELAFDEFDADAVFTAHNKDDNAETVLYRVIKGTGLVGLKGISQKRDIFYRPLLKTSRTEIIEYCEKNNLSPNNDSSNGNINYKRNYLRLNIIPTLEKINPAVKDTLNTLAEVATSENSIIEEYLATFRDNIFEEDRIISSEYKKLSSAVKKRFIHEYLQMFDLDYDYKRINDIYDFIEYNIYKRNGNTLSLASALWLYVDEKCIETIPRQKSFFAKQNMQEVKVPAEGVYKFSNKTITLKKYLEKDVFVFPDSTSNFVYVDLSSIKFPLTIRTRRDGDTINPFGMHGNMKLKKYLNSKGVSKHNRDEVLLLANDTEVLWVVGVGLSNKIGVSQTPTHVIEVVND
jgi:tRNA(Ile)-lysidine synthase